MKDCEHKAKKKQWRTNSDNYYHRCIEKKGSGEATPSKSTSISPDSINNTPASTDSIISSRQRQHLHNLARKRRRNNYLQLQQKNAELEKKLQNQIRITNKLRKRNERERKAAKTNDNLTPRTKTRILLENKDEKAIAKRVLFAETMSQNLSVGYKALKQDYDKRLVWY